MQVAGTMLPPDLRTAEAELHIALEAALSAEPSGRWTAELRFEGLRLLPVALRLVEALGGKGRTLRLLFPDAGAAALACRESPSWKGAIASFADQVRHQGEGGSEGLLVLVAPSQADYETVERLCLQHRGPVLLLNPNLEDAAVGIGSVARQRRRLGVVQPGGRLVQKIVEEIEAHETTIPIDDRELIDRMAPHQCQHLHWSQDAGYGLKMTLHRCTGRGRKVKVS